MELQPKPIPKPVGVIGFEELDARKGITVYIIELSNGFHVQKRYSDFRLLYYSLPESVRRRVPFPPKTGVVKATTECKLQRCKAFDAFVKELNHHTELPEVQTFFATKPLVQAGGHGNLQVSVPGFVTKKTDQQEADFYRRLASSLIPLHIKDNFFPKLKEVLGNAVTMEDLTSGYDKPCIMDVKMGTVTAGESANFIKKDKKTTTQTLGLRIVATRMYEPKSDSWQEITRSEANHIHTEQSLSSALEHFFKQGGANPYSILTSFLTPLSMLAKWMETQSLYRFYSSSLLFVYEGKHIVRTTAKYKRKPKHGGSDEGYYKGLQNLTNFISDYLRKSYVLHSKPSNMDISHKDHLFEVCRSVKRREDIGGEFFAKTWAPVTLEQARYCVCFLLHHFIETKTPGSVTNGDMINAEEESPTRFIFWIYGGGTYVPVHAGNLAPCTPYHYYFGIEVVKATGSIRLVDCTDEQWERIIREYGPTGRGAPTDFLT